MANQADIESDEISRAYAEHDRQLTINNIRIGCYLGMVLMPAGALLDFFAYRDKLGYFFLLRVACSVLIGLFLLVVLSPLGQVHYRKLGVILAYFPTFFIAWMIFETKGAVSPYYAGLNLVLLVVGFVLHWTYRESFMAVSGVMLLYLVACGLSYLRIRSIDGGIFFNNLYFLVLTGVIIVTGNHIQSLQYRREFALRFELDRNRQVLEEANQKLVELDRVKNRFFANISHELRTPLTLLIAPLESLLNQRPLASDEAARELLRTMQANGMRLLKLINDLLDLVRLESGRVEVRREAVSIEEFVKGLATSVRKVADDKRVRLETAVTEGLGTVLTDRDKLEKIVLNLLFNAIKFTGAGGRVDLVVSRAESGLVLSVTDTGMGIAIEHLPHIFDRFWQADTSSRRKYQGTGIGLALVKELVEALGGQVEARSQLGKGTTMTVTLPSAPPPVAELASPTTSGEATMVAPATNGTGELALTSPAVAPAPAPPPPEIEAAPTEEWLVGLYRRAQLFPSMTSVQGSVRPVELSRGGKRSQVLIADDEPDMLRFLRSELAGEYHVIEAVDGQQAVDKAGQFLPDLLLVDMMMPEKDGVQVCLELRAKTSTQNIPIIMLTARADEETKLSALSAGASDFLTKPFSTTELHVRVRNLVNSYHFQRRLARQKQELEAAIEQLKETESQLIQSEKLASLGRLSAGLIHEINNPLNYAKTNLYALKEHGRHLAADRQAEYGEILKDIEDGINRVHTIVGDLRSFTHPRADQFGPVEVEKVVTLGLRFLSHELADGIKVEIDLPPDQVVRGNQNLIVQILINLLQNSVDAMKTKTYTEGGPVLRIEGRREGRREVVAVRDNGMGIAPEIVGKVFDPFFTTKDVGQGMGLGLAICHRIMQDHGGAISVKSEPGKFCEFALEFPGMSDTDV